MNQSLQNPVHTLSPLDRLGWLADQPEDFRAWVARSGRWRRYAAGEAIYHAEDEPNGLYGLGNGTLEIVFPLDGAEPVRIHRAEPGFWIGESASLARTGRMVSLSCVTEALVYHIPAGAIARRLREEPESWHSFYMQSHINAMAALRGLAEALVLTPRARFARLLLRLADRRGEVQGTQEGLGQLAGMRPSTAKRVVGSLIEMGAIQTGYGRIRVVDRAALEAIRLEE